MTNLTTLTFSSGIIVSTTAGVVSTLDGVFQTANGPVAIKPASTAPIATDIALVVALSPNSAGISTPGQTTAAGSTSVVLSSDNNTVTAVGTVAAGSADNGNPLKIGGIYNTTKPTLTNGLRGDAQLGSRGALVVQMVLPDSTTGPTQFSNPSDGFTNNASGVYTAAMGWAYNGASWDRMRIGVEKGLSVTPIASALGGGTYAHIAAGTATTVVKASAGTLYSITFNSAATATNVTTIYDNATGAGTVIAIPAATSVTSPLTLNFGPVGIAFSLGLTIITTTANGGDMTVVYK